MVDPERGKKYLLNHHDEFVDLLNGKRENTYFNQQFKLKSSGINTKIQDRFQKVETLVEYERE